jgi:hypothetical protein
MWGQCPTEPDWLAVPLYGDGFDLKARSPHFRPGTRFGGFRRALHLPEAQRVAGRLATLPWPEVTALLLEAALQRDAAGELGSYCADYYTPADPRRYAGVMVEELRISATGPGRDLRLHLALMGRGEEPRPALSEADFDYGGLSPVPFGFEGAALSVGGVPATDVEAFSLQVRNNLAVGPNMGGRIAFLNAGPRAVSLELTSLARDSDANDAIRSGATLSFEATFSHPDGHALAISLPVLHPEAAQEAAGPETLARSTARMEAGTDAQGDDVTYLLNLNV